MEVLQEEHQRAAVGRRPPGRAAEDVEEQRAAGGVARFGVLGVQGVACVLGSALGGPQRQVEDGGQQIRLGGEGSVYGAEGVVGSGDALAGRTSAGGRAQQF